MKETGYIGRLGKMIAGSQSVSRVGKPRGGVETHETRHRTLIIDFKERFFAYLFNFW